MTMIPANVPFDQERFHALLGSTGKTLRRINQAIDAALVAEPHLTRPQWLHLVEGLLDAHSQWILWRVDTQAMSEEQSTTALLAEGEVRGMLLAVKGLRDETGEEIGAREEDDRTGPDAHDYRARGAFGGKKGARA